MRVVGSAIIIILRGSTIILDYLFSCFHGEQLPILFYFQLIKNLRQPYYNARGRGSMSNDGAGDRVRHFFLPLEPSNTWWNYCEKKSLSAHESKLPSSRARLLEHVNNCTLPIRRVKFLTTHTVKSR
jgi:hypothetical protein